MSRIEQITGDAKLETMAPHTTMAWNPVTNGGSITFHMSKYLVVDGAIRADVEPSQGGMLTIDLMSIITRCFVPAGALSETGADISHDPITGADLSQISVYGVMNIIKAAFAATHAESLIPEPTPEPTPEATPEMPPEIPPGMTPEPTPPVTPELTPSPSVESAP